MMRRTPGHPRASERSPYAFEHILVMEDVLGRYLLEGETVHHLNGVKDDNVLRTSSAGSDRGHPASEPAMRWRGRVRFSTGTDRLWARDVIDLVPDRIVRAQFSISTGVAR
jgi:hypothetical protein